MVNYDRVALLVIVAAASVVFMVGAATEYTNMWKRDTGTGMISVNNTNDTLNITNDAYLYGNWTFYDRLESADWTNVSITASQVTDLPGNETTRVTNIVAGNCTGQVVAGFYSNGTVFCEDDDNDGGVGGANGTLIQLLNQSDTDVIYWEEYA